MTGAVVSRPVLVGRLAGPARVTVVAAPAGSGKTVGRRRPEVSFAVTG